MPPPENRIAPASPVLELANATDTTMIVPANVADVAWMMSLAMKVVGTLLTQGTSAQSYAAGVRPGCSTYAMVALRP